MKTTLYNVSCLIFRETVITSFKNMWFWFSLKDSSFWDSYPVCGIKEVPASEIYSEKQGGWGALASDPQEEGLLEKSRLKSWCKLFCSHHDC